MKKQENTLYQNEAVHVALMLFVCFGFVFVLALVKWNGSRPVIKLKWDFRTMVLGNDESVIAVR